jgi:hypothetical protein
MLPTDVSPGLKERHFHGAPLWRYVATRVRNTEIRMLRGEGTTTTSTCAGAREYTPRNARTQTRALTRDREDRPM